MWHEADQEARRGLLDARGDLGFLGQLFAYLEDHPQADTEEILVRWSDEPWYPELLKRAQKQVEIGPQEMAGEFCDGVARLYQNLLNYQRRQALAELKENPDAEGFRRFMQSRER